MDLKRLREASPKEAVPTFLEVLRDDLVKFIHWVFATTRLGGLRRLLIFIFLSGFTWAVAAYFTTPIPTVEPPNNRLIVYPFYALFAAEVFRHVIVFALVFWLSLQLAAKYLDDVFELNRVDVAEKYIIQAAFASKYDVITIKEGRIAAESNDSPVALIGGPGQVRVYLDNAAVFESIDGKPRILGPTQKEPAILDRFERLRKGVLLRDHIVTEMSVTERTRDGITVQAEGARTKYSIFRNHQKSSLERPYPFDPNAVETQVYNQVKAARFTGHYPPPKPAPDKSDEPLKLSEGFIKGQLARFISESTLSEFLAFTDNNKQKDAESEIEFTPRDIITQRMYNSIDEQAKKERGAELYWVDIGTWVLPDEASEIPQQHREAWEISLKNLAKGNEDAYEKSFKAAKGKALSELMQEIILLFQLHRNTQTPQKLIDELALTYRQKLHRAIELYREEDDDAPQRIIDVFDYMNEVSGNYRRFKP